MAKDIVMYDKNSDMLYFSKAKAYSSIDIDNFILDFDKKGFLIGLELDNASKNLSVNKKLLSSLKDIRLSVTYRPNMLKLLMVLSFSSGNKVVNMPIRMNTPHRKPVTKKEVIVAA
ncbi:MAG: DUF2283 domain-containing protein [Candidatus Woesearchaeota archaeon]